MELQRWDTKILVKWVGISSSIRVLWCGRSRGHKVNQVLRKVVCDGFSEEQDASASQQQHYAKVGAPKEFECG